MNSASDAQTLHAVMLYTRQSMWFRRARSSWFWARRASKNGTALRHSERLGTVKGAVECFLLRNETSC